MTSWDLNFDTTSDFIFRYKREIASYQEQITTMQGNLEKTKTEMTERLHEYQELLAGTVHFSSYYLNDITYIISYDS